MNFVKKIAYATTLSVATLAPVVSSQVFAAPVAASTQQATNSLVQQLSGLQRFTADFEQSTKVAASNKAVQKKGLTAQQTIVTTGKVVWIYDPDLQQAVRQSLDDQIANTPALLLSGNTNQIMQSYRVTQPDRSKLYYTLYPKQEDGAFQSLTISFGANKAPNLMVLQDSLGQTTNVRFTNVKVNPTIPASVFNFTPPKGTDIIDQ